MLSLRERFYGAQSAQNKNLLKAGDVVLLRMEQPRSQWPLAKVVSLHPDREGVFRIVKVLSKGQTSLRTIDKLIPLELAEVPTGGNNIEEPDAAADGRPVRAATLGSQRHWRSLISGGHIT